jgi:gamma-D-glutamyl-L-lysine dipeptidyl-peptidase
MIASPVELVKQVQREYCSDARSTFADVRAEPLGHSVRVSGTVLDEPTAALLLGGLQRKAPNIHWRDELTPLVTGPDYSFALASRAVADIRNEPSNGAERVTQIIFGETLEILRRQGYWAFVRTQDGYLGWTHGTPLLCCSAEEAREWTAGLNTVVRQPLLACYADASGEPHQQVMLLPFGARLQVEESHGAYRGVRCPDGIKRWVPATGILPADQLLHSGVRGLRTVVDWAHAVIGVPYLWGGRTPFGYDCSGLVQILFSMVGVALQRDADQQFTQGIAVDFKEIEFGDAIFFDTSTPLDELPTAREVLVSHVGLAINRVDFLHASRQFGGVVHGSFDPDSPWFAPSYRERFLGARRHL